MFIKKDGDTNPEPLNVRDDVTVLHITRDSGSKSPHKGEMKMNYNPANPKCGNYTASLPFTYAGQPRPTDLVASIGTEKYDVKGDYTMKIEPVLQQSSPPPV